MSRAAPLVEVATTVHRRGGLGGEHRARRRPGDRGSNRPFGGPPASRRRGRKAGRFVPLLFFICHVPAAATHARGPVAPALRVPRAPWPTAPVAERARGARLAQQIARLRTALSPLSGRVRNSVLLMRVITDLARLARRAPRDPEVWYWLGWAARRGGDETTAIAAWRHLLRIAPNHHTIPDVTFALGVLLAKAGRYRESIRVYQHGMPRAPRISTRSIMASNCAESAMATGDLRLAVRLYRKSLALRPRGNRAAWWGLTVALDRLERTAAAERAARRALTLDPTLRGLTGPAVFFVPPGDVHYYLGMAYENADRVQQALAQFRRFLARLPRSRYAPRALEHVLQLEAQLKRLRPVVSLLGVMPPSGATAVRPLLREIRHCYPKRARRFPAPEGFLSLRLWLTRGRLSRLTHSVGTAADPALLRCVRRRLRGRRLARSNAPRHLVVNLRLQLVP